MLESQVLLTFNLKDIFHLNITICFQDYASFEHTGKKEYTDFQEVKDEIIQQTSKLIGNNHGISDDPIKLTIHSPNGWPN